MSGAATDPAAPPPLRATYRLQFTPDFGFPEGAALAPYLARLGISHVYASPIFAARPGSTHGYDVTDPTRVNPELGGEAEFRSMAAAFRAHGLGLILDIVPNHMGVWGDANRFWLDVLAWGPESRHAPLFDIDWHAPHPGLAGRILAPVLGSAYGAALAEGALELRFDAAGFAVWAHGSHRLPVCPRHYSRILGDAAAVPEEAPPDDPRRAAALEQLAAMPDRVDAALAAFRGTPGEPASWAPLAGLIARQHWRPAKYSLDSDALNYRRFFTISDLAGVRVEDPAVFDATHGLILALVAEGVADGLRIDHIDGLRDPKGYLHRLRTACARPVHLLVEKILAHDERLPDDWETEGTTGYEVTNLLAGLMVDPAAAAPLERAYAGFTGRRESPEDTVRASKRAVLDGPMATELEALAARLLALAATDPATADLGRASLRRGARETIVALDVYRTYADADGLPAAGRARLRRAIAAARRAAPDLEPEAFDLVAAVLGLDLAASRPEAETAAVHTAAAAAQQLSGPVMAKGLEDRALYRCNRLIALNEVGSEPGRFGTPVAEFHAANAERLRRWPRALLTTSTHDTKRGEDARARIAVLARDAEGWAAAVQLWHGQADDPSRPLDRNEAWFLYQLLLGAWPLDWPAGTIPAEAARIDLRDRVTAAFLKSIREAGANTRWSFGDPDYEAAAAAYVARLFDPAGPILADFAARAGKLARPAAEVALVQLVLKLTIPGIPDTYQGAEFWEQSLVDPDNRRPVDFAARAARLEADLPPPTDPCQRETKLDLTRRLLALRAARPTLFAEGSYVPLATGSGDSLAFLRDHDGTRLVVAARLRGTAPLDLAKLGPDGDWGGDWQDILASAPANAPNLLARGPVAVLLQDVPGREARPTG